MTYNIQIQGERRLKAPVSLFHGCVGKDITSKKITTLEEVWSLMRNPTKELQEFTQRLRTAKKDAPHLYKKMKEGTIDGEEIGCPAFIIGEFPERKDKA